MEAAKAGCLSCCLKFQEQAGKVVNGTTAMIQAAQHGHADVVGLLVQKEARMQDKGGRTALMHAAERGYMEIVKILIPHEAKMQNNNGGAAIHQAACEGHTEIVKLLIPFEAKMVTRQSRTAMMFAAQKGRHEVVELLLPYEAKMKMHNGWTALMSAAVNGHAKIVDLLLPYEAGLLFTNTLTAMTIASIYYHPECFALLLANEKERKASQIPDVMLSAYCGDIHDVLARQHEWETNRDPFTILNFALLGNQRRIVKLFASCKRSREFFALENVSRLALDNSNVLSFLSSHRHLLQEILPIIGSATAQERGELLAKVMVDEASIARTLRAICTPEPEALFRRVWKCADEVKILKALSSLKHLGFSSYGEIVSDLALTSNGPVIQYMQVNPLRRKQIALAKRQTDDEFDYIMQVAWREVDAESRFNRDLILKARDLIDLADPVHKRCIAGGSIASHKAKLHIAAIMLLDAYRYASQKLREEIME